MRTCIEHIPETNGVPVVATVPHSGTFVPPEIDSLFEERHRRWLRNTDWYLPQVYSFLKELGVTTLEATHSRYVVDVNRDPSGPLLGRFSKAVIAEQNQGDSVYSAPPDSRNLIARIPKYHGPFHGRIKEVLARTVERYGRALLLDLHSFMGPIENDICLGDRFGSTCSPYVTNVFEENFLRAGFDVVRNVPYRGGYIVRKHAAPPVIEALAIELRYTTYLDCSRIDEPERPQLEPERIEAIQSRLRPVFERAITIVTEDWVTRV